MTHEKKKLVWLCAGEVAIILRIIGAITKTKCRETQLGIAVVQEFYCFFETTIIAGCLIFPRSTHVNKKLMYGLVVEIETFE